MSEQAADLHPLLAGETITLRPLRADDLAALHAAAADPLIWAQHPDPVRHLRPVFEKNFFAGALAGGAYTVVENASGRIIGSSRYYDWNPDKGEIAIGYTFLARSHWGGATNGEMKRLMLDNAFRRARVVRFDIGRDNWRSRKAVEKIGARFSHEGRKEFNGVALDYVFYTIEASQWPCA